MSTPSHTPTPHTHTIHIFTTCLRSPTRQPPFSPGVNSSLTLLLRNEPSLSPKEILLFNHPQNKAALTISHGSGHFRVDHVTKTRPPASVDYIPEQGEISLTPITEGAMKVLVHDLCLETDSVAMSTVIVAGVYMIEVQVKDKLQLGNSTLAYVRILDNRQMPFPANQLRWVWLRAVVYRVARKFQNLCTANFKST